MSPTAHLGGRRTPPDSRHKRVTQLLESWKILQEQNTNGNGQDGQRQANLQIFEKRNVNVPAGPLNHDEIGNRAEDCEVAG